MRWFYRGLPPAGQPPTGIHQEDDFRPSPRDGGIIERLVGYWRGVPVYREPAPKAVFLRDPRAVANEKAAAERRAARGEGVLWKASTMVRSPGPIAGMAGGSRIDDLCLASTISRGCADSSLGYSRSRMRPRRGSRVAPRSMRPAPARA
jgi:hypothetical protein